LGRREDIGTGQYGREFPVTHWTLIQRAREGTEETQRSALDRLIRLYWKPTYCWLRHYGYDDATAKDLVQDFFLSWIREGKFGKADPLRGRFRSFLLTCLRNFVMNYERSMRARSRHPGKPLLRIDKLNTDDLAVELSVKGTPEDSFNMAWVRELMLRVLRSLEKQFLANGKERHYKLFRCRIIDPVLENKPQPSFEQLARIVGLTEKQASNCVITARRAYQRLLKEEIQMYASSDEEVASEIRDLFQFAGL